MNDETLLDIARRNLWAAEILYKNLTDDDGELNLIAYHLQQAVELALKHHLELNGVDYPHSHDIGDLLAMTGEDEFPELLPWSGTITYMESKTRYLKNYRTSLRIVKEVLTLTKTLLEKIGRLNSVEPQPQSEKPQA